MKKKFKIKKGSNESRYVIFNKIENWVSPKISKKYYNKKKGHYVEEIQNNIEIIVELRVKK